MFDLNDDQNSFIEGLRKDHDVFVNSQKGRRTIVIKWGPPSSYPELASKARELFGADKVREYTAKKEDRFRSQTGPAISISVS